MKKLNQKGALGVLELAAIGVVVIAVSFVSYRIAQVNNNVEQASANAADSADSSLVDTIKANPEGENEAKEVTIPDEEKKEEPKEETKTDDPVVKQEPVEEEKDKPTYLKFIKGGVGQSGSVVNASSDLDYFATGTCHFKFKKDGAEKVYVTSQLNDGVRCQKEIPVAEFSQEGEWNYHLWFVSTDKKFEAYQDTIPVEITF